MTGTAIGFLVLGSVVLYGGLITTIVINARFSKN